MGRRAYFTPMVITRALAHLAAGPITVKELAQHVSVPDDKVAEWLRKRHRETKDVHISGYTADERGRVFAPLWTAGGGEHAPRPPAVSLRSAARTAAYRARKKAAQLLNQPESNS